MGCCAEANLGGVPCVGTCIRERASEQRRSPFGGQCIVQVLFAFLVLGFDLKQEVFAADVD